MSLISCGDKDCENDDESMSGCRGEPGAGKMFFDLISFKQ